MKYGNCRINHGVSITLLRDQLKQHGDKDMDNWFHPRSTMECNYTPMPNFNDSLINDDRGISRGVSYQYGWHYAAWRRHMYISYIYIYIYIFIYICLLTWMCGDKNGIRIKLSLWRRRQCVYGGGGGGGGGSQWTTRTDTVFLFYQCLHNY